MGKPKLFAIVLQNPVLVFTPGQTVEGYVDLELDEEMEMKGIKARFTGAAKVRWSEGSAQSRITYTNHESYFDSTTSLFGSEQTGQDSVKQPPGSYKYPFRFQLPMSIPSSIETEKGRVRYSVEATIERPWSFDSKAVCVFTVLTELDLNTVPDAGTAVHKEGSDSNGCFCGKGIARIVVDIAKMGYVPGERIPIKAEVDNDGGTDFKSVSVELVMKARCTGKACCCSKVGEDEILITSLHHGALKSGESDRFNNEQLPVPPLPASDLPGCSIINVEYFLRIKAAVSGLGSDLVVPVNILIGTKPIIHGAQYSSFPPLPSYNDYVFGQSSAQTGDEKTGSTTQAFTPKYTYYDFGQSQSAFQHTATT